MVNPTSELSFAGNFLVKTIYSNTGLLSMILIVHSEFDVAGVNIGKCVLKEYLFKKTASKFKKNPSYSAEINGQRVVYISLRQESVDAQTLPENFPNSELIIFLSRHCSQSGKPTLSVHAPGNF